MIALHELEGDQAHLIHNNLQSFEIGDETITPTINFYSSDDDTIKTLTYVFDGKDIVLSLYYGVPNQAHDDDGEIIVAVNGKEIEFYADNHYGTYGSSQIFIHKTNELTFIIKGNINLWDVSFKEMRYWWQ